MKLTCVTAVFNAIKSKNCENLIRCVQSVASLKTPHEHLIYDGASTDGTVALLRKLEMKTPGLKVVSETDNGIYDALNKGVRDANGEWFYVLGCDDYICDKAALVSVIDDADKDSALCVFSPVKRGDNGQSWLGDIKRMAFIFSANQCCHQGILIKTSLLRDLGGFDLRFPFCADYWMQLQLFDRCVAPKFDTRTYACFAFGGSSNADDRGRNDRAHVLGIFFRLSKNEEKNVFLRRILPLHSLLKYLFHKCVFFRQAARRCVLRRFFDLLGLIDDEGSLKVFRFIYQ